VDGGRGLGFSLQISKPWDVSAQMVNRWMMLNDKSTGNDFCSHWSTRKIFFRNHDARARICRSQFSVPNGIFLALIKTFQIKLIGTVLNGNKSEKWIALKHFKFLYFKYVFQLILIHFLLISTESETLTNGTNDSTKWFWFSREKLKRFWFTMKLEPYQTHP
jgi:hypothetical protein